MPVASDRWPLKELVPVLLESVNALSAHIERTNDLELLSLAGDTADNLVKEVSDLVGNQFGSLEEILTAYPCKPGSTFLRRGDPPHTSHRTGANTKANVER